MKYEAAVLPFAIALTLSCGREPLEAPATGKSNTAAEVEKATAAQVVETYACETDADCFRTGCSGQICASQTVITTCEFRCEYGCLQQAPCKCFGRRCAFQHGTTLAACMNTCRDTGRPSIPCGPNACDPDTQFCCNESCGICAPIGGTCIQIVCTPS